MTENDDLQRAARPAAPKSPAGWQSGQAIWFFVGATFLFAWSAMLPSDANVVWRVALIAGGFVAIVGGIVEWVRAQRAADARATTQATRPSDDRDRPFPPPTI